VLNEVHICGGVRTAAEETITALRGILCIGAYMTKFLADSAPNYERLHVGGCCVAVEMCTALIVPKLEVCERSKDVPIVLHERLSHEGRGLSLPSS